MTGESSTILGKDRDSQLGLVALDQQIEEHKKADSSRSVLGWAVSQVWRSDEGSLDRLEKLSREAHDAQSKGDTERLAKLDGKITTAIKDDNSSVGMQGEISHYVGGGLKTAALFFGGSKGGFLAGRGTVGLAATVGLYGLDQATMSDDAGTFATNFAFGGAKGAITKGLFHGLGQWDALSSPAAKGIVLGMGGRITDVALTPSNYKDANGNLDLAQGLGRVWTTASDVRAMGTDAALFSAAHGLTRGANWLTKGAIDARPMYNTVITSASFGLSGGAYGELDRQMKSGESIDYSKIFTRALLQGGVDALAGIPGGLNADANFRSRPWQSIKEDASAAASRFMPERSPALRIPEIETLRLPTDGRAGSESRPVIDPTVPPLDAKSGVVDPKVEVVDPAAKAEVVDPAKRAATEVKPETAVVKDYPPEDVARAKESMDKLVTPIAGKEPSPEQVRDLTTYLKDHPEADGYAVSLYVRNFSNPAIRRALEAFYKPSFAMQNEVALAKLEVRESYQKFESAILEDGNRSILPEIWGKRIQNLIRRAGPDGPAVRELLEHHARTTYDQVATRAIDSALGTDYTKALEGPRFERGLPLSEKDMEYIRALAQGKPIPQAETKPKTDGTGTGEKPEADGSSAPRKRALGEPEEFTNRDLEVAETKSFLPPDLVAEAQAGMTESIRKSAIEMKSGTAEEQIEAATRLADQLHHPTASEWFLDWVKAAPQTHLSAAGELANPAVQALAERAPDAVREFLATDPTGLQSSFRFRSLAEIATAFESKPEIAEALVKIAGSDPNAMRVIGYELSRGFGRGAYTKWLDKMLSAAPGEAAPTLTLDQITGDVAMRRARIYGAFGEDAVAQYLDQFAQAQPEMAQRVLEKLPQIGVESKDGRPPRGADLQELLRSVVERRIAEGVGPEMRPEQLNPDLLQLELRFSRAFSRNPQALAALLEFARSNLDTVSAVIKMPGGEPQQQQQRGPRGAKPDRNDPTVKLNQAYTDFIGVIAPKAAELGPVEGLARLQSVQKLFADSIAKNKIASSRPDDMRSRTEAELAERELNKATNDLLPGDDRVRQDAQLRREAVAKQDAKLLPNGPPPEAGGGDRQRRDQRPPLRTGSTPEVQPRVDARPVEPDPRAQGVEPEPRVEIPADVVPDPRVQKQPEQRVEPQPEQRVEPQPEQRVEPQPEQRVEPQPEQRVEPQSRVEPKEIDLGSGPIETLQQIDELSHREPPATSRGTPPTSRTTPPTSRTTPPTSRTTPVMDDAMRALIEAEEQVKQESWRRRKGVSEDYGEDDGGGSGRGNKGKGKRSGRPRDWRQANEGDDWRRGGGDDD